MLSHIPSVEKILNDNRIIDLLEKYSRDSIIKLIRIELEVIRQRIVDSNLEFNYEVLIDNLINKANNLWLNEIKNVINATGVILHTNLGRAPLSSDAADSVRDISLSYSDLEFSIKSAKRGSRQEIVSDILCNLTGAESAFVVNNNASAVFLTILALCENKDVIVSRGEAVEIGGGFRIPDIISNSSANLVEIGTTNKTYVHDYETAINDKSGCILMVHTSNFKITGFTHSADISDLVKLSSSKGLPIIQDLGSGTLIDTRDFNLDYEPTIQDSIKSGIDLVLFSGDKLLGGPQSGIIVGKKKYLDLIKKHPIARAIRIDKLNLTALSSTLLHYIKDEAIDKIPVWKMISADIESLKARVIDWQNKITIESNIIEGQSTIGGGSLPGQILPTYLLSISGLKIDCGVNEFFNKLLNNKFPIVARIEKNNIIFDPRTVLGDEDSKLIDGINSVYANI
ncbi:MAG: L-seryl-tRNA(Sec) selenium transferase [Chloroflexi bacterium]|nr:L-seryl-tRNA(Sec) selenium transferase [Chloroflexota bacterium]MCH2305086.1 L-seryl-tRNA(Sec) selenium transferase [SAR202 cluster bacterium]|tara:strand:- start:14955 stop:16319 length:1365 start_codon:yes stop_codon:yes gene_type:complete